jgi:hypothetical protein
MNPAWASAFGLVIKLTYTFSQKDRPRLEIFPDSTTTRAEEWEIYGAKPDSEGGECPDVRVIEFQGPGDSTSFTLNGHFTVKFVSLTEEPFRYPKGEALEPMYHFSISRD